MRANERKNNELRSVEFIPHYIINPEGAVLVSFGNTKVICTATIEHKLPPFMRGQGKGWITAEYSMLPRATNTRNIREAARGKVSGRTMEIQRLIGRSLRAAVDLEKLGERTIWIDCDVIQADGGTRTASITGAMVAMKLAFDKLVADGTIAESPLKEYLAAISVGILNGEVILDLNYEEDSAAEVDMNVIMTESGQFVEIQGTGEEATYSHAQLLEMLDVAIGEESNPIQAIFEILTTKSNQLPVGTTSLVSPMATLNDYHLENGILTLNVSPEFLDYTADEEQDLLSSLVWTYTELVDVDKVKFEIDGEPVSNLNGTLPVSRGLDRSMGINLELDTTNFDETQLVTLYFVTDDSKDGLLVPVTRLIPASTDPVTYAVSALIQGPVNQNYVSVFDQETTLLSDPVISDGLVSLNFSSELYYDSQQTKVSSTMLKQLVMTLTELDDIEMVSVSINGNIKVMDEVDHSIAVPTSRFDFESLIEAQ